ncbi:hypothetical protein [Algicella marina]|uniref:Uncharacterized protein n=1 Tax=Algicella marina TaxID=2683284 RepID=A0A6P1SYQ0_9RHOB|nr:hypothetical protein [Algicella marina]QHQ34601.1 hypothetical protein GO499_05045 [Algicella marina]
MENPGSKDVQDAYAIGSDGRDGGTLGDSEGNGEGPVETAASGYSGLNRGVGYDIGVEDLTTSDRGQSLRLGGTNRDQRGGFTTRRSGPTPGSKSVGVTSSTGGTSAEPAERTVRPLSAARIPREEDLRRRQIARIATAETVVTPSAEAPEADVAADDPRCRNGFEAKSVTPADEGIDTQDDLNAALVGNIDATKVDALLDNGRIRILDEETPSDEPDCPAETVVTAAAEQLGDGTVLGPVTISSKTDHLPARRRQPSSVAHAPNLADSILGNEYRKQQNAERLPLPTDETAVAKLAPALAAPQGRPAQPQLPTAVGTLNLDLSETPADDAANAATDEDTSMHSLAAAASAALGDAVVAGSALTLSGGGSARADTDVDVGAKSTVSHELEVTIPDLPKREVPILRSGR